MSYLADVKKKLDDYVDILNKKLTTENPDIKFLISYTYIMKFYYEFLYNYKVHEVTSKSDDKAIFKIINEINKTAKLLDSNFPEIKIVGGKETVLVHKKHMDVVSKWNSSTPKKTIIRTLEKWTGAKGEMEVFHMIAANAAGNIQNTIYNIMAVHNFINASRPAVNGNYYTAVLNLIRYYLKHQKQYMGKAAENIIKCYSNGIDINVADGIITLNSRLRDNYLADFGFIMSNIIDGIDKLDLAVAIKLINEKKVKPENDEKNLYLRKSYKKAIKEKTITVMDYIHGFDENPDFYVTDYKLDQLLQLAKQLVITEQEIETNLVAIKEIMEVMYLNGCNLLYAIEDLVGPNTDCCIKKVAANILFRLKPEHLDKKKKLTEKGKTFMKEFI